MKCVTVFGARPQFIKALPVSRALANQGIAEVMVHTGQHFDAQMSQVFFDELQLPTPQYHLGISRLHHSAMTGRMLEKIGEILQREQPDGVLVYGDTNSTLAGALAARQCRIPLAHVEAGLRNGDRHMPEELNRILTDRISDILLCPSVQALENLSREGFKHFECELHNVGDVMRDAVELMANKVPTTQICQAVGVEPGKYLLATVHRDANTTPSALRKIISAFAAIASAQ